MTGDAQRITRALRGRWTGGYSRWNGNSIDLVLFLNGLPVATVELKTDFTQGVQNAVDQYRFDRLLVQKGQGAEPLLSFLGGALVHFAVSDSEAMMTTRLDGPQTRFLPFNRGDAGGKGNPVNPDGHRTAYLWEDIWQRDSLLEILGRFMVPVRDGKKKLVGSIFPRFHQLDAVRALRAEVLKDGPGGRYLIQHSAGSGKTNSIAWAAHMLADLHDEADTKLFDTVLVVSDRTVIDAQLQEAIFNFERTTGVVMTISGEGASKSAQLAEALAGGGAEIRTEWAQAGGCARARSAYSARGSRDPAMKPVEIYTTPSCGYCHAAKRLLAQKGVPYTEIGVAGDPALRAAMVARAGGRRTVPQIFIGDTHVGGCDDLHALEAAGRLDALLEG